MTPARCRPAIRGALSGCLALLELPASNEGGDGGPAAGGDPPQGAPALAASEAVQMMSTFAGHVFVRSLGQQDRCLAFRLMDRAMEVGAGSDNAPWAC
jgi:hypothetical protein